MTVVLSFFTVVVYNLFSYYFQLRISIAQIITDNQYFICFDNPNLWIKKFFVA